MTAEFYDACKLTDRAKLDEMGLSYKAVMDIALNFTSASIFRWGHMHSDIHPVRPLLSLPSDRSGQCPRSSRSSSPLSSPACRH